MTKDKDIIPLKPGVSSIPTYGFGDNIAKDRDIFYSETRCKYYSCMGLVTI